MEMKKSPQLLPARCIHGDEADLGHDQKDVSVSNFTPDVVIVKQVDSV